MAETHYQIGSALQEQRDFEGARFHYSLSMEIQKGLASSSLKLASCHRSIGLVLRKQRKVGEALENYQSALAIVKERAFDSSVLATSYKDVGWALQEKGFLEQALEHFFIALDIETRESFNPLIIAVSHDSIGSVLKERGDFDQAFEHYQSALEIREKEKPDSMLVALSYNNIGALRYVEGDLPRALFHHRAALNIEECEAPNTLPVASTNNSIGMLLLEERNPDEALEAFYRALAVQEIQAKDSLESAATLYNIGLVMYQKRKFIKARKLFGEAHVILGTSAGNVLGPGHPYLICCTYYVARLAIAKQRLEQALTHAAYLIDSLPDFKWSYELKGHALRKLERYEEALHAYDDAISVAPNFADAHLGRLRVFSLLSEEMKDTPSASASLEQRIALACNLLLSIEFEKEDDADKNVHRHFDIVTRRETPRLFAMPLPEVKVVEKSVFLQKVIVRLGTLHFEDVDLGAEMHAIKQDAVRMLSNQVEFESHYHDLLEQILKKSEDAHRQMKRLVENGDGIVTMLSRSETYLIANTTKAKQVGSILRTSRKTILSMEPPIEKSQALLSFLCTAEGIPCPKLIVLVPQCKEESNTFAGIVNLFQRRQRIQNPFECKWHCLFVCQATFRIVNSQCPMEIDLDRERMQSLAPLLKASLVAISLVYRNTQSLPLELPFPGIGLKDNMAEFDLMYKNVSEDEDYDIVASLDRWVVAEDAETWSPRDLLKMKRLVGKSFRAFSDLARQVENRWCWETAIEPCPKDGRVAWIVKGAKSSNFLDAPLP